MPKSTCQTSPRSGTGSVLLLVQRAERSRGQGGEIIVRQIIRHGNTFDDGASKLLTLLFRELLELAENLGDCLCHVPNIHKPNQRSKRGPLPSGEGTKGHQLALVRYSHSAPVATTSRQPPDAGADQARAVIPPDALCWDGDHDCRPAASNNGSPPSLQVKFPLFIPACVFA